MPVGSPVFLQNLPQRPGDRPVTNPCLPHAQRSDHPSKEIWLELCDAVFGSRFPGCTGPVTSSMSLPTTQALVLNESVPCFHSLPQREWSHVHEEQDGSLHLILSEADAHTLLSQRWGERHLMAGQEIQTKKFGTIRAEPGLVMVYAPRTREEIQTVLQIMTASYQFCRGDFLPLAFWNSA